MKERWVVIAEKELGVKEYSGETENNPRILEYHAATTLHAKSDKTPWCASFVSWCLKESALKSPKTARARNFLKWGIKLDTPKPGCIVVFTRGKASGHVGFYFGEATADDIWVLGGNQSDQVCVASYAKSRVLGYRWPSDAKGSGPIS